ncbi:MAG: TraR/DksA C4-type zinc finger protein [Chloroflexota bacterium]
MSVDRTELDIPRLETQLSALCDELRREIEVEKKDVEQLAQAQGEEFTSQHQGDLGSDMFLEERALSTQKALESELSIVEQALARIADGTYGLCERCGQTIPTERLLARPQAIRCIDCERKL